GAGPAGAETAEPLRAGNANGQREQAQGSGGTQTQHGTGTSHVGAASAAMLRSSTHMAEESRLKPLLQSAPGAVLLALQDRGDAHAAGGADRDQAAARTLLFQQLRQCRDDARAGGGERVAHGEAGAVHV